MKKFQTIILEQKNFSTDTMNVEDEEIEEYLNNEKVIIVHDKDKVLFKDFKSTNKISKDKILGTLKNVPAVFMNLKINKDNHFYYFNAKNKAKVQKIIK